MGDGTKSKRFLVSQSGNIAQTAEPFLTPFAQIDFAMICLILALAEAARGIVVPTMTLYIDSVSMDDWSDKRLRSYDRLVMLCRSHVSN